MKAIGRWTGGALLLLLAAFVLYECWIFAHVLWWTRSDPDMTRFMSTQLAVLRKDDPTAQLKHRWVPYAKISRHLKQAVVAAEDDRFLEHEGFDWDGIQRAIEKNQKRGAPVAGGSTISQQLAKNLFLSPSRSYVRKAQEAIVTLMIESTWSKRRILEVYLNVVEWGRGVFGAEAAARHYYSIPAAALGPEQAARLAVMLPNPRRYERQFGPRLSAHAARIQARMHRSQVP
ncbi:monofunctional biosynthetic peptidoglycan transglycosylase [Denitromonas iodatirespirans]|uniref:Biosynthetic peptidoglycan transglycosylase n=1 Tax=Denitromonas iodatirespirans TaxID=2795389 RepID=A0A944H624_DENI1|nr:monofunctional biosynthetic peptidoglycan transglycosylase [Denitromonas iodatirespirans]MBT0959723.1 monofunctional biosynthetic peptidoglycan transglycosylase [Denitromonas iodatirespirans]